MDTLYIVQCILIGITKESLRPAPLPSIITTSLIAGVKFLKTTSDENQILDPISASMWCFCVLRHTSRQKYVVDVIA